VASFEDTDGDGTRDLYYYTQDHLGGTALTTDSSGTVVQLYDYYPYGSERLNSQPTGVSAPSEHSFTDKELDSDLGLYYFEARWYNSEIGRFASEDPAQLDNRVAKMLADPQSLNFYAYSRNNPVNLTDPSGEFWDTLWDVANLVYDAFLGTDEDMAFDVSATMIPGVPAGFTKVDDLLEAATKYSDEAVQFTGKMENKISDIVGKYNWSNPNSLIDHVERHGDDFGINSLEDYAKSAQDFFEKGMDESSGYFRKVDDNGTIRIYDSNTDTFGSFNPDGSTRTYYKPNPEEHHFETNMDYWDAQKGNEF